MWPFNRLGKAGEGATGLAERPESPSFSGSDEELFAEIARLSEANGVARDSETERQILRLRHLAAIRLLATDEAAPEHPAPDFARLPETDGLPEIAAADLTPELLRAGILRDGCVLVRGLIDRDDALDFAAQIDRSFEERERLSEGGRPADGYYDEFAPGPPFEIEEFLRDWVKVGGGVLAADAPMLATRMLEMFREVGLLQLVAGYLGEPSMISVEKTTLRKAEPEVSGAWHQDGAFMGDVRALNLWLSLSRCGDEAPGLDIVPRRLDWLVESATDEAVLDYQVSQSKAEAAAGDIPIIRPIFEPGDALLFDELFLHQTASDPSMPNPRFAIESWFFGASGFPDQYAPIAV